jgi:hypothetical protein
MLQQGIPQGHSPVDGESGRGMGHERTRDGYIGRGGFPIYGVVAVVAGLACMESLVGVGGTLRLPAIAGAETRLEGSLGRAMGMEKAF